MTNPSGRPSFQFLRVISALMIREMITRYGRSAGGYVWAVLEPVGMIAILSFAFSQFIRTPAIGESFILFYATGYVPFHLFHEISSAGGSAVAVNRPLMQLPMVRPLDAIIARGVLSFLTFSVVSLVVFSGILFFVNEQVRIDLGHIALALAGGAALGFGVGTLNAVLFAFVPTWQQIWGIVSRPLFLISGVFFTFQSLSPSLQALLWWNPLIHVVGEARMGFYAAYDGSYVSLIYVFATGIGTFALGAALLLRHQSFVVDVR